MYVSKRKNSPFIENLKNANSINNIIYDIKLQSNGKILMGGLFTSYDSTGNYLVRLNSDVRTDTAFSDIISTSFSNLASTLAVQSDGKILVGGGFTNYGGTTGRNFLVRLNSTGSVDSAFCTNASNTNKFSSNVNTIAVQSDGAILVGGSFASYGGTTNRNRLIRLLTTGVVDSAFCALASDGPKFNGNVNALAVQPDGKILVGGAFSNYAGTAGRDRLIRLNSDGSVDSAFCALASDTSKFGATVNKIIVQPDGKILVGGSFTSYGGTFNQNYLVRLNSDGSLDSAFCALASNDAKFTGAILSMEIQPDGKILLGGSFTNYAGTTNRNRLIRLNSDGSVDSAFCINASDGAKFSNLPYAIVVQPDGKILVGGAFTNYAGVTNRNRLIRLTSDGNLDPTLSSTTSDGVKFSNTPNITRVQPDGKILIAGSFTNYGGITGRNYLIRLNSDGSVDDGFCALASDGARFNNLISAIELEPDGSILIGGSFSNYGGGGVARNYLVRLYSDGMVDNDFCLAFVDGGQFSSSINCIAVQSNGYVLVGGSFLNYGGGGIGRDRLVRLTTGETVDDIFCANASDGSKFGLNNIYSIVVQPDGSILLGGDFVGYLVANRNSFIKLNSSGTLDTGFCSLSTDGGKFTGSVNTIKRQSDGKILVAGNFINYGTTGTNRLIRLNSDGSLDSAFCALASDGSKFSALVNAVAIQPDGAILASGNFINYAGTTNRNRLIRLNSDGSVDNSFCANASDGAKFSSTVSTIEVQSNGGILAAGGFTNYKASTYSTVKITYLARLGQNGALK